MVARDPARGAEMIWSRASIEDPSRSGWPYVDLLHLAASLAHARERALFIGCGGAVGPRQFAATYPGIRIDIVESQSAVVELARRFFGLDDIPYLTVHLDDGASFLENAAACSWDIVIADAYGAGDLSHGIVARDFFAAARRVLRPGGAMAFNVVGALDGTDPVASVVRGATRHFEEVRIVPVVVPDESYAPSARRNVVVLTRRRCGAA
jgi:spermidine synthase